MPTPSSKITDLSFDSCQSSEYLSPLEDLANGICSMEPDGTISAPLVTHAVSGTSEYVAAANSSILEKIVGGLSYTPLGVFGASGCTPKKEESDYDREWCKKFFQQYENGTEGRKPGTNQLDEKVVEGDCLILPSIILEDLKEIGATRESQSSTVEWKWKVKQFFESYPSEAIFDALYDLEWQYLECASTLFDRGKYYAGRSLVFSLEKFTDSIEVRTRARQLGRVMDETTFACPGLDEFINRSNADRWFDDRFDHLEPWRPIF